MPDIFDQIAPDPKPNALQQARQNAAPKGDIFDQIAPDPKPNALASARQNVAGAIPTMSLEEQKRQLADQPSALSNAWNAAKANAVKPLANLGTRLLNTAAGTMNAPEGLVNLPDDPVQAATMPNPDQQERAAMAQNAQQDIHAGNAWMKQVSPYDPNSISGQIGSAVGTIAPAIASGPFLPQMMAAQGFENRKEGIEDRRAAGENISDAAESAQLAGGALLDYGLGKLAPGGAVNKAVVGRVAPAVTNPLAAAAMRAGVSAATGAGEQVAFNAANNALAKATTTPDQSLMAGSGQAALQGLALGGGGQIVHEGLNALAQARARVDASAAVEKPNAVNGAAALPEISRDTTAEDAKPAVSAPADENAVESNPAKSNLFTAMRDEAATKSNEEPAAETGAKNLLATLREKAGQLVADDAGGASMTAAKTFANRDVVPAVNKLIDSSKNLATEIDRSQNLGLTTGDKAASTELKLRKMQGDAEAAGHAFDSEMQPHKQLFNSYSPDAVNQWMDSVEATGSSPDPKLQPAADAIRSMREQNAARGKKLGINNLDEAGGGLARMFEFPADDGKFPSEGGRSRGGASAAGTNRPFFHQRFDTFSEARAAAEAAGGRLRYSNPLDAQIARQYEVEKNLAAREEVRRSDKEGTLKWFPDGTRPDAGFDTKLNDPLVGTEERQTALPRWMVGKLSKLEHFDALQFLQQNAGKMVDVRPGEQPPDGYAFTGTKLKGSFHGDADNARFFNNMLTAGRGDPVASIPGKIAKASLFVRYAMSPVHAMAGVMGQAQWHAGQLLKDLMPGGNKGAVGRSLIDAMNPFSGLQRGAELRQELENPGTHPQLSEAAKRVQSVNPGLKLKRSIDTTAWGRVADEFKAGNPVGGTVGAVKQMVNTIGDVTYNKVLSNIVAGGARNVAESHIANGLSEAAGRADLAQATDTLSKMIGHHVHGNDFQSGVARDIGRIIFPAYDLIEGQLRVAGGAVGDATSRAGVGNRNPHALAAVAGAMTATALSSTVLQMGLTYAQTGKAIAPDSFRDLWQPRTGRKDANGHDERITLPGMVPFLMKMAGAAGTHGFAAEAYGRLNPLLTGGYETYTNKDYEGNQVRPTDGSTAGNVARGALHTVRGMAPIVGSAFQNQSQNPEGDEATWGQHLARALGVQFGHPVTSDAEQSAYDTLAAKNGSEGRTPEKQKEHDDDKRWLGMIRSGNKSDAIVEMKTDPAMSENRARSLFKRARESQGLAGIVSDSQLGPDDLLRVWNKATDDERASMKRAIGQRLGTAKPGSRQQLAAWKALRDAWKANDG